jgi:hypothetical protein
MAGELDRVEGLGKDKAMEFPAHADGVHDGPMDLPVGGHAYCLALDMEDSMDDGVHGNHMALPGS